MIQHEGTLISLDVLEEDFVCNLSQCKGACCVEGDFGAPLNEDEIEIIERDLEAIKPFMTAVAVTQIEEMGFAEKDPDGDLVTQCIKGRDCVFAISEKGVYKCAIEKAYEAGKTDFKKPISCHLYPIRLSELQDYTAINYSVWDICTPACTLGKELKVPVYKFLKEPLQRKFGVQWYKDLELIAKEFLKTK
ncbi:MAG: DUF3109 family protein [Bacteroidetes bacterium]|nr:DUF3109 family protein [Bacteroidota bacterium]